MERIFSWYIKFRFPLLSEDMSLWNTPPTPPPAQPNPVLFLSLSLTWDFIWLPPFFLVYPVSSRARKAALGCHRICWTGAGWPFKGDVEKGFAHSQFMQRRKMVVTPGSQGTQQQSLLKCLSVFTCYFPWGTETQNIPIPNLVVSWELQMKTKIKALPADTQGQSFTSFQLFVPGNMRQPWEEAGHRWSQKCFKKLQPH